MVAKKIPTRPYSATKAFASENNCVPPKLKNLKRKSMIKPIATVTIPKYTEYFTHEVLSMSENLLDEFLLLAVDI